MGLLQKAVRFAGSPQGRRAIQQARTRLDTPENRQRATDAVRRLRETAASRGRGGGTSSPPGPA